MKSNPSGPRAVEAVSPRASSDPSHEQAIGTVRDALARIDYGSIVITIHQGEVVGIETSTKVRIKRSE
jgi:hypothetical protein